MDQSLRCRRHVTAGKFRDPALTAGGNPRATVALKRLRTLWFNTGTLCNIACVNCYIESSPANDALVYLSPDEVALYLDEIAALGWHVPEIGFTGGEPFMNPGFNRMCRMALERGHAVLVLTNAMQPMMRPQVQAGIRALAREFGTKITFRVSLDHWSAENHDALRGAGSFARTLQGMHWLRDIGARLNVAGRSLWNESEEETRAGFAGLFRMHDFNINAQDPAQTVIFPEIDENADVPEITTACWDILGKSPDSVMCATSRMVVKRKGAAHPVVLSCTLLPYDPQFELGRTLAESAARPVALNHPHCAKFCVLGGASCSA